MLLDYSICSYWIGKYEESKQASLKILEKKDIPQNIRECVQRNLEFAISKIVKSGIDVKKLCYPYNTIKLMQPNYFNRWFYKRDIWSRGKNENR